MTHMPGNERHRTERIAIHRRRIVRILFVDDKESDVELCLQELKRMDFAVSSDWVQTREEFSKRLRTQFYEVIVCDYSMPAWNGMEALEILNQADQQIPFIMATGSWEEDTIEAFMRKGAFDCI